MIMRANSEDEEVRGEEIIAETEAEGQPYLSSPTMYRQRLIKVVFVLLIYAKPLLDYGFDTGALVPRPISVTEPRFPSSESRVL
jgi:hypothetical protein